MQKTLPILTDYNSDDALTIEAGESNAKDERLIGLLTRLRKTFDDQFAERKAHNETIV